MITDFEQALHIADKNERRNEIKERLDNYEERDLRGVYQYVNSYNGNFDFIDVFFPEEIDELSNDIYSFYDILVMVVCGNVNSLDDWLRLDSYGNIESVSECELDKECLEHTNDLADWLLDNYWHVNESLYDEDRELLEAWEEIDNGTYYDDGEEE